MKKTIYFTGRNHNTAEIEAAIESATDKRDEFLKVNERTIGEIDNEEIIITPWNGSNTNVIVTIKLTYYSKKQ